MEREVKFLLADLEGMRSRLESLGARLEKPRVHEYNLRFDRPGHELARSFQVLRLRRDAGVRVTYKGPGKMEGGVRARQEIEFEVGDFEAARALFESLGYHVSFVYEKHRTTYRLGALEVVLDETPLGNFAEIEGPDAASIRQAAARLGLRWEARIVGSYLDLFEAVKTKLELACRDLTFENFEGVRVAPEAMGAVFGDR